MAALQDLNYYEILGISINASQQEVKNAFREKAKRYHPDVSSEENAVEIMKVINLAYETLSDLTARKKYDKTLKQTNEQAYGTYTVTKEQSEKDLEMWLKIYLEQKRFLSKLYREYVELETKIFRVRRNFGVPNKSEISKSQILLSTIKKTLHTFVNQLSQEPSVVFDTLFEEIKEPIRHYSSVEKKFGEPNENDLIIITLLSNEINAFVDKYLDEENQYSRSFIIYVCQKYVKISAQNTVLRGKLAPLDLYQEYLESILLKILKSNSEYVKRVVIEEMGKKY